MSASPQLREVIHHLYRDSGDLLPYCGVIPGADDAADEWHAGHDRATLLQCLAWGLPCCTVCLSPEALSGWTPGVCHDYHDDDLDIEDDDI